MTEAEAGVPPESEWTPEWANQRREELILSLKGIDHQLRNRDRKNPDGSRMSADEFFQWRNRALTARVIQEKLLMRINRYLRLRNETQRAAEFASGAPFYLLPELRDYFRWTARLIMLVNELLSEPSDAAMGALAAHMAGDVPEGDPEG